MKTLKFARGLLYPTLAGEKKMTFRKYAPAKHDFKKSEIVIGEFEDGLSVLLCIAEKTIVKDFASLTAREAQEHRFRDADDAFNGLKRFYPDLEKSDPIAIIRYEILTINDTPVVCVNEHLHNEA